MIIEIQYRDKINWESVSGKQVNWTNYSKKYKEERIQPYFVAPEIVLDNWNGREHDVQHTRWTSYYFEIYIKESEIESINQLKSCSDINIIQYATTDSGLVVNQSFENIDLVKADLFEMAEPERIGSTSSWKVSITFRTERTVINKALPVNNTNNLSFQNSLVWQKITGSTVVGDYDTRVTQLSNNSIAVIVNTPLTEDHYLSKYTLINGVWTLEGNTLLEVSGTFTYHDITALDESSVAIISPGGKLRKYEFDGTDWSPVGSLETIPVGGFYFGELASFDSSTIVSVSSEGILIVMTFDGLNWSQVGTTFNIPEGGSGVRGICVLSSTRIAYVDNISDVLRSYDWNGSTFILHSELLVYSTDITISITALSSEKVLVGYSNGTPTMTGVQSYYLTSKWTEDSSFTDISGVVFDVAALDVDNAFVLNQVNSGKYFFERNRYYTDFDVVGYDLPVEDVLYQWMGDPDIIIQSVNKQGNEVLIYCNNDDYLSLIKDIDASKIGYLNYTTELSELKYEAVVIGDGLHKVIVRGISNETITNKADNVDNTNYISIGGTSFYTDFLIEYGISEPRDVYVDWSDGSRKLAQSVYQETSSLLFFFNDVDGAIFESVFYKNRFKVINGVTITQDCSLTIAPVGNNYYSYIVNCISETTVTPYDLAPNTLYSLSLNNGVSPELFYTDYEPELISETPEIDTASVQTGVNKLTKSISKTVKQMKFYKNETDAFRLKQKFELYGETGIINGTDSVLEARPVSIDKIGVDLYEVTVDCLIDTDINY